MLLAKQEIKKKRVLNKAIVVMNDGLKYFF